MTTQKTLFLILVFTAVMFECFGDVLFKKWALAPTWFLFTVGMILWMLSGLFWVWSLKYELLTRAGIIYIVLSMCFVVAVGILYFKEELTVWNKLGLAAGAISVILLEL